MRPEFLNRIDEIVMFKPLLKDDVKQIVKLQFDKLVRKASQQKIQLSITDEALSWLAEISYDINYGARPIKRMIQKKLVDPLSLKILSTEIKESDKVIIDTDGDGKFIFKVNG